MGPLRPLKTDSDEAKNAHTTLVLVICLRSLSFPIRQLSTSSASFFVNNDFFHVGHGLPNSFGGPVERYLASGGLSPDRYLLDSRVHGNSSSLRLGCLTGQRRSIKLVMIETLLTFLLE
jgi:hypothetical protein